ncbi:uncharacterized protein LOC121244770 [Juglans microcarpa x Juglans regia]|uniref:uncharacterized protein LOC121244770 n=1 Tax=Juglans microcarpa x Juglans regia TaxID=2249226 RepID=UPI001B7E12E7|nr:uncharacterized protein LOC121244770 [Juglans microcarpa x Juglans regia]
MCRALRAKNKLGFISGNISKPTDEDDPLFDLWERCNDMVVSWIQNSISMDIRSSIAFVDDAQAVWTELNDQFTQQNGPRIFQLKRNLVSLRQDRDSVSAYFGNLKTLWNEIAIYDPISACTCGQLSILNDRHQRDHVIQFLMGLNDQYANARDQIMLIEPLPTVNKVFSLIQQQEQHHQLTNFSPTSDSMALATKTSFKNNTKNLMTQRMDRLYCTHCQAQGHTLENCFKAGNAPAPYAPTIIWQNMLLKNATNSTDIPLVTNCSKARDQTLLQIRATFASRRKYTRTSLILLRSNISNLLPCSNTRIFPARFLQ